MEVQGKPKQEATNCVAQTVRLSQAPGKGQRRIVVTRNLQQQL
jgi:hypothetical protein